jgi:hypothetical protein
VQVVERQMEGTKGGIMMQTSRYLVPLTVLLALLLLCGCSKKPDQAATPPNSDSQGTATQATANGATPDDASNTAPASSANAPAADSTAAASQQMSTPPPLVIPAGTPITVRLQQRLSSASAVPGERFEAVIDEPVVVEDRVVVPVGALATGHVVVARHSGRLHHPGELGLALDNVTVGQENIPLVTSNVVARGGSHKTRNWAWIGGGGAGGALIGGLAGGGKGALIGGPIGAAAGTTTAFITGKKDVAFGSERRLRFRLNRDINVTG